MTFSRFLAFVLGLNLIAFNAFAQEPGEASLDPSFIEVEIESTKDGTKQPSRVFFPQSVDAKPLLIFLHSWSHGLQQDNTRWQELAKKRGWVFLQPHFRGKNDHPEACGFEIARQDILEGA